MPTPGQDCTITLQHPAVNGGAAVGFWARPDRFSIRLPKIWLPGTNVAGISGVVSPLLPGKRVIECVLLCRPNLPRRDGTIDTRSGLDQVGALRAFAMQTNSAMTLTDPHGNSYTVGCEEMELAWSPRGDFWRDEWEVRCVFVEV